MKLLNDRELYRRYMEFFELAERNRRWSLFDDVPWEAWRPEHASADLALCAETFCGVEMYLPDYVQGGLNLARDSFGQAWFHVNWGYEESKHGLALREYLVRSGQRAEEQMEAYARDVLSRRWTLPYDEPRQMVAYGVLQEKTTWLIYRSQMARAKAHGDVVLSTIFGLIARDEAAHAAFYQDVLTACLAEDRAGTLADMSLVFAGFEMPAYDLVPDYEDRVRVMRAIGVDRAAFLGGVVLPVLRRTGVDRRELARARPGRATDNERGLQGSRTDLRTAVRDASSQGVMG